MPEVEIFEKDATVACKFSIPFIGRIQQVLLGFTETHNPEEMRAAIAKIKAGSPDLASWEQNLETILILINTIETQARIDGQLKQTELPRTAA